MQRVRYAAWWNSTRSLSCGTDLDSEESVGNMSELSSKQCVPCRGGVPPLQGEEINRLLAQLNGWEVVMEHHLKKNYGFANFREALAFVNRVGELAEGQGHHPDVCFGWG